MRSPNPQTRSPEEAVAALLLALLPPFMMKLRQEMSRARYSSLTMPQFRVLSELHWGGPANNKAIAENLGVTVANSSRMIDLLVKKKLVVRGKGLTDKREVLIRLSPKGEEHFQEVQARLRAFASKFFEGASGTELEAMELGLSAAKAAFFGDTRKPAAQSPASARKISLNESSLGAR